jgi:hypothetical protein
MLLAAKSAVQFFAKENYKKKQKANAFWQR